MSVPVSSSRDTFAITPTSSAVLIGLCAGAGIVLTTVVPRAAGWLLGLPWVPFEGPVRLLRSIDVALDWPVMVGIGLLLGVVVGLVLRRQTVSLTLDDRELIVTEGSKRRRVARSQADAVLVAGRHLTVRDRDDIDLVDVDTEASTPALSDALTRHGWPVRERA